MQHLSGGFAPPPPASAATHAAFAHPPVAGQHPHQHPASHDQPPPPPPSQGQQQQHSHSPTIPAQPAFPAFAPPPSKAALPASGGGAGSSGGAPPGNTANALLAQQQQQTNPRAITRTTVACLRCRRGKQKCVNDGYPPCQACISRGCQDECTLGERGKSGEDRAPRAPRKRRAEDDVEYGHSQGGSIGGPASYPAVPHSRGPSSRRGSLSGGEGSPPAAASALFAMQNSGGAGGAGGAKRRMSSGMYKEEDEDEEMVPTLGGGLRENGRAKEKEDKEVLPPLPLLIEGCEAFFSTYFQLSFLHRPSFLHKLSTTPDEISPFLLLAMLAVSARFCEGLIRRHGGSPTDASAVYAERAMGMAFAEMTMPSLERVQALYMLGIHDFGNGQAFRSKMFQNLARQMAEVLKLHEEVPELSVTDNEVRRRTWWFLTMDANLLNAVGTTTGPFDPRTVPIPLPSQESDFAFGIDSRVKQYFAGATSEVAKAHPPVAGEVSLLSALLGIISIFGRTARAISASSATSIEAEKISLPPWHPSSLLQTTQTALTAFLATLSPVQLWSTQTFLAYRTQNLDLGFMCIHADVHTVNVLLRRAYLPKMIRALAPAGTGAHTDGADDNADGIEPPEGRREFYRKMAEELAEHAFKAVGLLEEVASLRPSARGVTPHIAFCTFLGGTILNYLRLCPWLSPTRAPQAPLKLASTLSMLQHISSIWPIAKRWHQILYIQVMTHRAPFAQNPEEAAGIAQADLAADQEAGLYRQYAPETPSTIAASSPAHQLDAASALAALAQDAQQHALAAQHQQPQNGTPASPALGSGVKRFSAHLRQAAPPSAPSPSLASPSLSHLISSTSVSTTSSLSSNPLFASPSSAAAHTSGTPTPFSLFSPNGNEEDDKTNAAASGASDLDALLALDLGDMTELNRFLVGWGAFGAETAGAEGSKAAGAGGAGVVGGFGGGYGLGF
ncbi:hypothetical protein JCM6882_008972 [Rhodosporidiobolus microsporus]